MVARVGVARSGFKDWVQAGRRVGLSSLGQARERKQRRRVSE